MKLQKLCYLAHGYHLAETAEPLVDELFEAWKFGPVLPSLYHQAKGFGNGRVSRYLSDYDPETRRDIPSPAPENPVAMQIIDFVWDNYGNVDAMDLSVWTHEKEGPWDRTVRSKPVFLRNMTIPNELIADYFSRAMYASGP